MPTLNPQETLFNQEIPIYLNSRVGVQEGENWAVVIRYFFVASVVLSRIGLAGLLYFFVVSAVALILQPASVVPASVVPASGRLPGLL